ncbi:MAG TPA: hypothetical protein PLM34_04955 [Lentimicrobium sp.]|nr:hypothetical protein [Lentimicrobium sp.]
MNTQFNTIETIRTNPEIKNKSAAYLAACDQFEVQASEFYNNSNVISRKSAEEVSINYDNAKNADCEYSVYIAAHAAECWLAKAWNNAE